MEGDCKQGICREGKLCPCQHSLLVSLFPLRGFKKGGVEFSESKLSKMERQQFPWLLQQSGPICDCAVRMEDCLLDLVKLQSKKMKVWNIKWIINFAILLDSVWPYYMCELTYSWNYLSLMMSARQLCAKEGKAALQQQKEPWYTAFCWICERVCLRFFFFFLQPH